MDNGIEITVDTTELTEILEGFPVRKDRAMHDLMSDIAKRSKSWVAQEIAEFYNILIKNYFYHCALLLLLPISRMLLLG